MLIVTETSAFNTELITEIYTDDDKLKIALHTGSEQGYSTPTLYQGDYAKEIFDRLISAYACGDKVFYIANAAYYAELSDKGRRE